MAQTRHEKAKAREALGKRFLEEVATALLDGANLLHKVAKAMRTGAELVEHLKDDD